MFFNIASKILALTCLITAMSQVDASASASATHPPEPGTQEEATCWQWRNNPAAKPLSPVGRAVTIQVPPNTDIWRPAKDKHVFTAPFLYTTIPARRFRSVRVTVSAVWRTLFDQAGLALSFPPPAGEAGAENKTRFIKAGIEFFEGEPQLGVVGTDSLSDWSLSPLPNGKENKNTATILIERDEVDVWVYVLEGEAQNPKRRPLRQITWAFGTDLGPTQEMQVGVYGAKPTREPGEGHEEDGIAVTLSGFKLDTA